MEQPQYHLQSVVHAKESLEDFDGPLDVILLLLNNIFCHIHSLCGVFLPQN